MRLHLIRVAVVVLSVAGWVSQGLTAEPIVLKYKSAPGEKLHYKTAFDLTQSQSIMGMKFDNKIKQETIDTRIVSSAIRSPGWGTRRWPVRTWTSRL